VLPYFRRAEDQERGADELHGVGGPLAVSNVCEPHPLCEAFLGAVEQAFTHFTLELTVYAAAFDGGVPAGCFWVNPDAVGATGFSSVMRKAIEHALSQGSDADAQHGQWMNPP
jgi:choline dehydrogenase-like flavoprotein